MTGNGRTLLLMLLVYLRMLSVLVRIALSEDSKSRISCDAVFGLLRETSDQSVDVGFSLHLFRKLNDP